ncbi:MAG: ATP-binding cassette domain-containing protein [Thermoguttaceae bacterium]|nr:ATP-binding cassette domain-containing protein [Thermoguttaceae bacterium]
MPRPILKAENLVKRFGVWRKTTSVDGFTAQINSGEIVGLLGGNGAGKSTTFDMISGLTKPTSGTISQYQPETDSWRDITNEPLYKRAQHGICYLPQKPSVFENLTTRQNLLGIMEIMKDRDIRNSMSAYDASLTSREDFCDALLNRFDLYKRRDEKVGRLSGGEKRRLEIARSFIRKPQLILLDEPYNNLDKAGVELCAQMFLRVRDMGVSILIVDHRTIEVLKLCNRVIFLNEGVIYASGKPCDIVRQPLVQEKVLSDDVDRALELFPRPGSAAEQSSSSELSPEMFKSKSVRFE